MRYATIPITKYTDSGAPLELCDNCEGEGGWAEVRDDEEDRYDTCPVCRGAGWVALGEGRDLISEWDLAAMCGDAR